MTKALIAVTMRSTSEDIQRAMYILMMSYSFAIKRILNVIFAKKTRRYINPFRIEVLIDVQLFFSVLTWGIRTCIDNNKEVDDPIFNYPEVRYTYNVLADIETGRFRMDILLAVIAMLFWLKVFLIFKITRFFGHLIKIVEAMSSDIIKFVLLWLMSVFTFACFGCLLFPDV